MLHRRHHRPEIGLRVGGLIGAAVAAAGFALVELGRVGDESQSLLGAALLIIALQPLVKTCVGFKLGIRFSGIYLRGFEPRVKLRFGAYLASPVGSRVAFHLAGVVGSPAGAAWAWQRATGAEPSTSVIAVAFWILIAIQLVILMLGLTGRGHRLARVSSGGMAGEEIRSALTRWRASPSRDS